MIIAIRPSGGSFRGAGLYYLHDKAGDKDLPKDQKPKTDERVWFTDTRNCANFDPELALDEMWHTAESQQWLKAQAGGRTSGRTCEDPVKTLSISWHKDDAPTPEHMIAAADAYLAAMKWSEHQAVYVGHRDTEHRHLHIILNRVHPETGRTLDDYRDHPRSQAFALAYEKEHGKLWCVDRELNAAEREKRDPDLSKAEPGRQAANTAIPHNVIEMMKPAERQFDAAEAALRETFEREKTKLKEQQKQERIAFFEDGKRLFRATRVEVYNEVKAEFRERWAALYKHQKSAKEFATATVRDAMLSAYHFAKQGDFASAKDSLHDRFAAWDEINAKLAEEKAALVAAQKEAIASRQKEACDILMEARRDDYDQLLERQRGERATMTAAHAQGQSAAHVFEMAFAHTKQTDLGTAPANTSNVERESAAAEPGTSPQQKDAFPASPAADRPREQTDAARGTAFQEQAPTHVPSADATSSRLQPDPKMPFDPTEGFVLPEEPAPRPEPAKLDERWQNPDKTSTFHPTPPIREGAEVSRLRDPSDAVAATIGAAADYLADQLGELFAPTPPEQRQQQVAQSSDQSARADAETNETSSWDRDIEAIVRLAEQHAEDKRAREYWSERDRHKDRERDR